MGGESTSRGILVQTMAAVLKALKEEEWEYIELEKKGHEKVDISIEYEKNLNKVIQVKHSINPIKLSELKLWIEDLVKENEDASSFELIFYGECSEKTLQSIRKKEHFKNSEILIPFINKIEDVKIYSLIGAMNNEQVKKSLNHFLTKQGWI